MPKRKDTKKKLSAEVLEKRKAPFVGSPVYEDGSGSGGGGSNPSPTYTTDQPDRVLPEDSGRLIRRRIRIGEDTP
jgi:hypothetical protein